MWLRFKKNARDSYQHTLSCRYHIIILLILNLIAYVRTVGVPFYYDDFAYVVNNPLIRDFSNYFNEIQLPANILEDVYINFKKRPLSYLSFSMNYFIHGTSPGGYHVVNIVIHAANSILVYYAVISIFVLSITRKGVTNTVAESSKIRTVAFFSAALFVTHPVMTNAVTYITQRMASLTTLFYLAAVVLYARHQIQSSSRNIRALWYFFALISCCAAMFTKGIAFTLPIILILIDFVFCHGDHKQRLLRLAPFVATMCIIPYNVLGLQRSDTVQSGSELLSAINLVNFTGISSLDYFVTQLKVIIFYLRLMVMPTGLSLEHDFPLSKPLLEPGITIAIMVHSLFVGYACYLLYRYRHRSSLPDIIKYVAGFGIIWFYLTLSVESGIVPITELAVEWRLYLPAIGFLLFFVCMVYSVLDKYRAKSTRPLSTWVMTLMVLICLGLTVARNEVWRVPEKLWGQTIQQYPFLGRPYIMLADYYLNQKNPEKAIKVYQDAIDCIPAIPLLRYELGNAYIEAKRYEEAVKTLEEAVSLEPEKKEAYYSLAKAKCYLGEFNEALQIGEMGDKAPHRYYQ